MEHFGGHFRLPFLSYNVLNIHYSKVVLKYDRGDDCLETKRKIIIFVKRILLKSNGNRNGTYLIELSRIVQEHLHSLRHSSVNDNPFNLVQMDSFPAYFENERTSRLVENTGDPIITYFNCPEIPCPVPVSVLCFFF